MKNELTPQEQIDHDVYRQGRFERAQMPVNKPVAEECLRELFKMINQKDPEIIWTASPRVAQVVMASLSGYTSKTPKYPANEKTLELAAKTLEATGRKLLCTGAEHIETEWFSGDGWSNGWLACFTFEDRLVKNTISDHNRKLLHLQEKMSDVCSFIYSFENITIMTERAKTSWTSHLIADRPVLHNPTGPSVQYPDWELFHWRGTQVPRQWIMTPNEVDPANALQWENIDQRLALCEILGWGKIIEKLNPTTIDKDENPMFGELLEVTLPDVGRTRFLRAQCGTGRTITLLVDENATTAVEAGAKSYGLPVDLYRLTKVRT